MADLKMGPFSDGWTRKDVEEVLARGAPGELLYVPLVVAMDPPDCAWAQEVCLSLASHQHFYVRGNAILGFGHLARTCGQLDLARVLPVVSAALHDENDFVRSHAEDAVDDIEHFLRVRVRNT